MNIHMGTHEKSLPEPVQKWVSQWLSSQNLGSSPCFSLLAGDGSVRQFFRAESEKKSFIVLYDAGWTFSRDYAAHQKYLASHQLPVPVFHKEDPEKGCLIMQDLGSELLQERILSDRSRKMAWLNRAVLLLADLHGRTFPVPSDIPAFERKFDGAKYEEELRFTWEHLVHRFLSLPPLSEAQGKLLSTFCHRLGGIRPEVFCHRDYHTRNLMVHEDNIYMIDFQDARLGPVQYDLASLIFDAYIPLTEAERKTLCEAYESQLKQYPLGRQIIWDTFVQDLQIVAFQRTIKAAGSFASFFTRYGKKTHFSYLLPALKNALELKKLSHAWLREFSELFDLETWISRVRPLIDV